MKGIYVSERLKGENRQLNICFAFPEKEMSPEVLQKENWALSSELQRGLLSAAAGKNAVLQFVYFEDHPKPELLKRQTAELKKYDMVIFVGHQLEQLQREIAGVIPAFRMVGDKNETIPASMIPVDYDRDAVFLRLARHIRACGCRTAGMIGMHSGGNGKVCDVSERLRSMRDCCEGPFFLAFRYGGPQNSRGKAERGTPGFYLLYAFGSCSGHL